MKPLIIYTDGSCIGNPGPGGWGAVIQHNGKEIELSGPDNPTTNNRMEMMAIVRALQWVKENKLITHPIEVYSDSRLIIKSLNEGWKRKANLDIWTELDDAREGLNVTWNWVKGHAGNRLNERCDRLAVAQSEKAIKDATNSGNRTFAQVEHPEGEYACNRCHTASVGELSYMKKSRLIRVDCSNCGKYIKFATKNPANLKRAKKNPRP